MSVFSYDASKKYVFPQAENTDTTIFRLIQYFFFHFFVFKKWHEQFTFWSKDMDQKSKKMPFGENE